MADVVLYKDAACEKALKMDSGDTNSDFSLSSSIFSRKRSNGTSSPRGRFTVWAKATNPVARVYCAIVADRFSTILSFDEDAWQGKLYIPEGGKLGGQDIEAILKLIKYSSAPDTTDPTKTLHSFKTPLFFVNDRGKAYRLEAVDSAGNPSWSSEKPDEKSSIYHLKDIGDCSRPTPINMELTDDSGGIYAQMGILLMWG
ncbi:hypothetical protein [uncultured Campylobacter sp.]|uniref:hypothetical protein n=1 Tax=uncultured Campylobacter sp. TaxID=218934 RepID=UPI0026215E4C|nr:hypothetical protein [uncultured Campylobacter sp.]